MTKGMRAILLSLAALSLAACGADLRRSIGLTKTPPDEFTVVSRAPLQVPPEFGLRPPQPGAARPNELSARDQARVAVFGATPTQDQALADRPAGEADLLKRTGAVGVDNAIRDTVNRESALLAKENTTFADALIFWRDPPPPGVPVDAAKEAERLRQNAAAGNPVTTGDTPVIRRKRRALFDTIF